MGHEVVGEWLLACLRTPNQIAAVIDDANRIATHKQQNSQRSYPGFELQMDRDDVRLNATAFDHDSFDDGHADDLSVFDDEQKAECGLDDFIDMLLSWQAFILSR